MQLLVRDITTAFGSYYQYVEKIRVLETWDCKLVLLGRHTDHEWLHSCVALVAFVSAGSQLESWRLLRPLLTNMASNLKW